MTLEDFQVSIENLRVSVMLQRMEEAEDKDPMRSDEDDSPLAGLTPLATYYLSLSLAALDTAQHHAAIAAYHQRHGL
jgi:hypothetical protein